jgi:hypothetical protein
MLGTLSFFLKALKAATACPAGPLCEARLIQVTAKERKPCRVAVAPADAHAPVRIACFRTPL